MKNLFLQSIITILVASSARAQYIFVGTYTKEDKSGVYVYKFDEATCSLSFVSKTQNIPDPSYLALSTDKKFLYAVNELSNSDGGVTAFSFDNEKGTLQLINKQITANAIAPCHLSIDGSGKFIAVANYGSGNFHIYPLQRNGSVMSAKQSINLSVNKKSNAHQTYFARDNRFLFVTDLGENKICQYHFDASKDKPVTSLFKTYHVPKDYGPRHLAVTPNNKFLYVLNEWKGNIFAYRFHEDTLQFFQEIISTDVQDSTTDNKGSAAIKISPDGKFVYASNRGNTNNISIFKIKNNGQLKRIGEQKTDTHPRDFLITRSGKYILVAARDSNTIKVYKRNSKTGLLTYTGKQVALSKPVMLLEH